MSVVEDSRKLLQDFVAPELRAIDARLTALEQRVGRVETQIDKRFDEVEKRFDRLEKRIDDRFDALRADIRELKSLHELQLRMDKPEAVVSAKQERAAA